MIKKIMTLVVCSAFVAGCQTTNPYTGEQETLKSAKYGGIGAVAGAIIGVAANGKNGALAGAAIGGLSGAGYGLYTDRQEAALRARLQGTGVRVQRVGNDLKLIMPGNITFDSNDSSIRSSFYPVLGSVARVLKEYDKNLVLVVGHTDSTGNERRINMPLSQARADSVASYLSGQGVPRSRITAYGVGSSQPVASNKSAQGRELNRRVEIELKQPAG